MQRTLRMKKEVEMLSKSPPFGISCWPKDDKLTELEAQIVGGEGTPYQGGVFKLEIQIPERYPFEPPKVRYVTPIYHPNIDNGGRICLDTLKMPPKGAWKPCLNISTVLTSLQLLMAEPNPEDPLMTDISNEFKYNRSLFTARATDWTQKHAVEKTKLKMNSDAVDGSGNGCGLENGGMHQKQFESVQPDHEPTTLKRPLTVSYMTNKRGKPS